MSTIFDLKEIEKVLNTVNLDMQGDKFYLNNVDVTTKIREKRINELSRIKWDADRFWLWAKTKQIIACNIDYWIIVASAKNPDFSPWFIDRYNILMEYSNIKPIISLW